MTRRERTYQREGDVDDLIKKNITKIYTLAVIIRDLNYKILRENYKKKKNKRIKTLQSFYIYIYI